MKSTVIFSLLISSLCLSQTFDCNTITKSNLISVYGNVEGLYLNTNDGEDVIYRLIDGFKYNELTQLCINSKYEIHKEGIKYT